MKNITINTTAEITRTITTYHHYMGRFNPATGSMDNVGIIHAAEKLGSRQIGKVVRDNPEMTGAVCYHVQETTALYRMPVALFIAHATVDNENK